MTSANRRANSSRPAEAIKTAVSQDIVFLSIRLHIFILTLSSHSFFQTHPSRYHLIPQPYSFLACQLRSRGSIILNYYAPSFVKSYFHQSVGGIISIKLNIATFRVQRDLTDRGNRNTKFSKLYIKYLLQTVMYMLQTESFHSETTSLTPRVMMPATPALLRIKKSCSILNCCINYSYDFESSDNCIATLRIYIAKPIETEGKSRKCTAYSYVILRVPSNR